MLPNIKPHEHYTIFLASSKQKKKYFPVGLEALIGLLAFNAFGVSVNKWNSSNQISLKYSETIDEAFVVVCKAYN